MGVVGHAAGDTEDRGVREIRRRMQSGSFLDEHLVGDPPGGAALGSIAPHTRSATASSGGCRGGGL